MAAGKSLHTKANRGRSPKEAKVPQTFYYGISLKTNIQFEFRKQLQDKVFRWGNNNYTTHRLFQV